MKPTPLILTLMLASLSLLASHPKTYAIRSGFVQATQEKDFREEFYQSLLSDNEADNGFFSAYLGATKTLMAESSVAPWTKYTLFSEGTALIEEAIALDADNAEFRYLRFLIQFNAPSFLDYSEELERDYSIIKNHIISASTQEVWMDYFKKFEAMHAQEISRRLNTL